MQTAAQISHRKGENKMKKLFMVCNAHLDPVWLWNWQEGAAAAIATFRTAADICEESEGFVFCHNEALLYSWVEEYEPALFQRIRRLVEAKKWHIMGGWYLQPDCNLPSGESILRQIIAGKRYFMEKFHAAPTVAVNFDTFGHSRGLVQILRKCGYTGYLFMRPGKELLELPSRNIRWRGFDGSEILAHRLDCSYGSAMGHAAQDAESWCRDEASESISLFTWGVGNHGGGPSRRDVAELDRWIHAQPQIQAVHSTPEAFFQALEDESVDAPVFAGDLRPVFVGCYTAQARVKQLHRELENHLFAAEKLLTAAAVQGLTAYPSAQLHEAEQDLLFAEFHDILPGTTIQECEADSIGVLQHGLTTVSRLLVHGREIAVGRDRQDAAVLFRKSGDIFLREVDHEFLGHGIGQTRAEKFLLITSGFPCKRQPTVRKIRRIPRFKGLRPFVRLRHGVGCYGREIDHHAALGQSRIERLDHIDRTDRIDFIAIFNNTAEAFTFEKK